MERRLRFTLAHELAHWIIHDEYFSQQNELASKSSNDSNQQTEQEVYTNPHLKNDHKSHQSALLWLEDGLVFNAD